LTWLLYVHISAGFTALAAALLATVAKSTDVAHRWHVLTGTIFVAAMAVVVGTALPLSINGDSPFLLLVAIFSGYLAATGYRLARNRGGAPAPVDWLLALVMAGAGAAMLVLGLRAATGGDGGGIVLLVFGAIGTWMSIGDVRGLKAGGETGRGRIASHLIRMLAAAIATLTAFTVTNLDVGPEIAKWLGPTILITPVIVWWSRRIRAGFRPRGMPGGA
jgi:hypothetical protein